jgi:hypothetical protein
MIGDAVKVTPQLNKAGKEIPSYFPWGSSWIDLNNYDTEIIQSDGKNYSLKSSDDYVHVHLRAGKAIPI